MWVVDNRTPFDAAGTFTRNQDGAEVWIVAVKGTFYISEDGTTEVAETQEPVCRVPVYTGEPGQSSLKYDMDLIPEKPATDVILHGNAVAPEGKPVKELDVLMRVGPIQKKLKITGDQKWQGGLLMPKSSVHPFTKMPLVYERAFGGKDVSHKKEKKHGYETRNPVGTGYSHSSSHRNGMQVPNIHTTGKKSNSTDPAGFGPIPGYWEPRVSFNGTFDASWHNSRRPLLPEDFDMRFYQQAPPDQQVEGYLKGGEPVTLVNLCKSSNMNFSLPEMKPECITHIDMDVIAHDPNLHTVIIEPDESRLMMVWHMSLECHNREHLLEKTVVKLKKT